MTPRIVVDASVVLKWLLPEPGTVPAERLLARYAAGEVRLIGPAHLTAEVASVLIKQCRRKLLSPAEVRRLFEFYERIAPAHIPIGTLLMSSSLEMSLVHQFSLWDSLYVALAVAEGCVFVTADRRLYRAAGPVFPNVRYSGEADRL